MRRTLLFVGLFLAIAASRAYASNLTVIFDTGVSDSPAFDPNGAQLTAIMQAAASKWENIIEDNHSMEIRFYYDNLNSPTSTPLADALVQNQNADGTRTTKGRIRFNTANSSPWFFDATPGDDSEFNMSQTQIIDLPFANWTDDFEANTLIEPLLEIGYGGFSNGMNAAATAGFDALSTAMHEIGHLLGVTRNLTAGFNEADDFDWDLPPSLLGGRDMAAKTGQRNDGKPASHIQNVNALMAPTIGTGFRSLPSALDVLAMASVSEWTDIDLERQDFLVGTNWGAPGNWVGGQAPGAADDAFLRGTFNDLVGVGDVHLDQNDTVRNLFVGRSSNLHTNGFRLDVSGATTIEFGGEFPFSQIFVETGGELETGDLVINGGELDMEGGLADIQDRLTNNDGNISGFGTVDVQTQLLNNGDIVATDGGTLNFTTSNTGNVFIADGTLGQGRVRATGGNIVFQGNIDPAFSGQIEISGGRFLEINNAWRLTPAGAMNLNGTASTEADLRGAAFEIEGTVNVDKRAELDVAVTVDNSADINLPDVDDRLELGTSRSQAVTYKGGSITGLGTLVQNGDAEVPANYTQTIAADRFDWDGATQSSTTLRSGSQLIINSSQLTDTMDGTVNLDKARLDVNTAGPWQMRGEMNFLGGDSLLTGSELRLVSGGLLNFAAGTVAVTADADLMGEVSVAGAAEFRSVVQLDAASLTNVSAGGVLDFKGDTFYQGGTVTGGGIILQTGNGVASADQTIDMPGGVFDWDGANDDSEFLVNTNRTFTLNAYQINQANNIYSGDLTLRGGTINVNVKSGAWQMDGKMRMEAGKGGESAIVLGDPVDVYGDVIASGGVTHYFAAPSRFLAAGTELVVLPSTAVHFNAPVEFLDGDHGGLGEIAVNDRGSLTGGRIRIDQLSIGGSASFNMAGGEIRTNELNLSTGEFQFNGGRLIPGLVRGSLVNQGGVLAPGPGTTPTDTTVIDGDYTQTSDGTLELQIASSSAFDYLKVAGEAKLDGVLDVSLLGAYTPALGDAFDILSTNGLTGSFANLLLPTLGGGLEWAISYNAFNATLEVIAGILPGDYNDDGTVDSADYTVWRDSLGQSLTLANDLTPGSVSQDDYNVWRANYGANAAPVAVSSVASSAGNAPEPGACLLILTALGFVASARRGL